MIRNRPNFELYVAAMIVAGIAARAFGTLNSLSFWLTFVLLSLVFASTIRIGLRKLEGEAERARSDYLTKLAGFHDCSLEEAKSRSITIINSGAFEVTSVGYDDVLNGKVSDCVKEFFTLFPKIENKNIGLLIDSSNTEETLVEGIDGAVLKIGSGEGNVLYCVQQGDAFLEVFEPYGEFCEIVAHPSPFHFIVYIYETVLRNHLEAMG